MTYADQQIARQQRREPLLHLLSRMQRGVLLDAERPLLRAAVETELSDGDQAHVARISCREDAETNAARAERSEQAHEQHRQRLAAAFDRHARPGTVPQTWDLLIAHAAEANRWATEAALGRNPAALRAKERAEQAEAGRVAADNMLRAVCDVFGGPHRDPVVDARETLARAAEAEQRATQQAELLAIAERTGNQVEAMRAEAVRARAEAEAARDRWKGAALEQQGRASRAETALTAARAEAEGLAETMRNTDRLTSQQLADARAAHEGLREALRSAFGAAPDTSDDDLFEHIREAVIYRDRADKECTRLAAELALIRGNDEVIRREASKRREALAKTLRRGPGADWYAIHAAAAEAVRRAEKAERDAKRAENLCEHLRGESLRLGEDKRTAEAALARVREIKKSPGRSDSNRYANAQDDGWDQAIDAVRAALGDPQPAEAEHACPDGEPCPPYDQAAEAPKVLVLSLELNAEALLDSVRRAAR